jgi:hypothetical protein
LFDKLPMAKKKHGRFLSPWPKTYKKITDILQLAVSNFNAEWNELPQEMNTLPAVAVDKAMMQSTAQPHITWVSNKKQPRLRCCCCCCSHSATAINLRHTHVDIDEIPHATCSPSNNLSAYPHFFSFYAIPRMLNRSDTRRVTYN